MVKGVEKMFSMDRFESSRVEVLGVYGSDLNVVNAARVSFNKQKDKLDKKDENLIHYLLHHEHWTPFAHATIQLRITAPIFVARQWFRHTIGVGRNEVSRRYVDNEVTYWLPEYFRLKAENKKQGSLDQRHEKNDELIKEYIRVVDNCNHLYTKLIALGVAPEQARAILPQATMTSWVETGSLYYYMRFCLLRNEEHAQKEIQELARYIEDFVIKPHFPLSYKALQKERALRELKFHMYKLDEKEIGLMKKLVNQVKNLKSFLKLPKKL